MDYTEIEEIIDIHQRVKNQLSEDITGSHQHLDILAIELMKYHKVEQIRKKLEEIRAEIHFL
jgi:hypothetical protein